MLAVAPTRCPLRDDGDRVEALEYQIDPIGTLGEKIELESVLPHRVGDPMLASFVVVEIGISDEPGGEQVEVDATRHGRQLEDLLRSALGRRDQTELPAIVQSASLPDVTAPFCAGA